MNQSLQLAVIGGIGITVVLLFGFVAAFLGYRHEPGAAVLFIGSLCFLVAALFRFLQDVRLAVSELDHHH